MSSLTRYLYVTEEVKHALLIAILRRQEEHALFWAYELFHSGFETHLVEILWRIYYDFYATMNPRFEKYFTAKNEQTDVNNLIAIIVPRLCVLPMTTDVFLLKHLAGAALPSAICNTTRIELIREALVNHNRVELARLILTAQADEHDAIESFAIAHKYMDANADGKMVCKRAAINGTQTREQLIFIRIMQRETASIYDTNRLYRRCMSVCDATSNPISDKEAYVTLMELPAHNPYNVLSQACKFDINCSDMMHLFVFSSAGHIQGNTNYHDNWLYYATGSPYWRNNILKYGGVVDEKLSAVVFADINQEEAFYAKYALDPDEQPLHVQQKQKYICKFNNESPDIMWMQFYRSFNAYNIVKLQKEMFQVFM